SQAAFSPCNSASEKPSWANQPAPNRGDPALPDAPARSGEGGEEVISLVVDHDEGRKIDDLDPPDRLHAELGVLDQLDLLYAVLRQPRRRPADRAQIKAAVLFAGVAHLRAAIALGQGHEAAARGHEFVDIAVHAAGGGRAERARGIALRRLRRPGIVDRMVLDV